MKRIPLYFFAAMTVTAISGCGSTSSTVPIQKSSHAEVTEVPEWFTQPPKSDATALNAVATENSRDLQLAIDKATMSARIKISEQMRADISSLQQSFKEEGGKQEDPAMQKYFNQVADQFSQQTIRGSSVVKQKIVREDGSFYRTYVLVTYPLGQANEELLAKLRQVDFVRSKQSAEEALKKLEQRRQENREQ